MLRVVQMSKTLDVSRIIDFFLERNWVSKSGNGNAMSTQPILYELVA